MSAADPRALMTFDLGPNRWPPDPAEGFALVTPCRNWGNVGHFGEYLEVAAVEGKGFITETIKNGWHY